MLHFGFYACSMYIKLILFKGTLRTIHTKKKKNLKCIFSFSGVFLLVSLGICLSGFIWLLPVLLNQLEFVSTKLFLKNSGLGTVTFAASSQEIQYS